MVHPCINPLYSKSSTLKYTGAPTLGKVKPGSAPYHNCATGKIVVGLAQYLLGLSTGGEHVS